MLVSMHIFAASTAVLQVVAAVAGLALLILIIRGVVRSAARKISNSAAGVLFSAVSQDLKSGKIDSRLQQPRALNGMDRIYLPQIAEDFPGLNIEQMRARAERLLLAMFEAVEHQDISLLPSCGAAYRDQVATQASDLKRSGRVQKIDDARILRTVISAYQRDPSMAEIVFQSAVEAKFMIADADGRVLEGDAQGTTQLRFEQAMVYVQNPQLYEQKTGKTFARNCPNCGAPVREYGAQSCPYCGSEVNLINTRVWEFVRYART
jgi:endogenous inhibitor of DNA gyrase (YacG/DUF329 family)